MMKEAKQFFGFEKRPACGGQFAPPGGKAVPEALRARKELPAHTKPIVWGGGHPPRSPIGNQTNMGTAKNSGSRSAGIPACFLAGCRLEAGATPDDRE
jgi:hypothetical protein